MGFRAIAVTIILSFVIADSPPSGASATLDPESLLRSAVAATVSRNLHPATPVMYPSPAYYNPYLRDSFWAAQALGNASFSTAVLRIFAASLDRAGRPPTLFVNAYRRPVYHDDESAALLLIWAWRNRGLYGQRLPSATLERTVRYLLSRTRAGSIVSPAGAFGSWWDAYAVPRAGTFAYVQGLYAVALRCAVSLHLALPAGAVTAAERGYRSLFDPRLGYVVMHTALPASDASALTGEFLSLWLFKHAILSNDIVFSTLRHLTPFGAGFRVVTPPGGNYLPAGPQGEPGDYQNGAAWLLFDALTLGAAGLHGLPNALPRFLARVAMEFRHRTVLHEYLRSNPSLAYYGDEPPARDYFSWDVFAVVVDQVLRAQEERAVRGLPPREYHPLPLSPTPVNKAG